MNRILLALVMACYSLTTFANTQEQNATNDEIRDAIIASFQKNDLNCVDRVKNAHHKASSLRIARSFDKDYTLTVSSDHSQPVIIMEKFVAPNNPAFSGYRYVMAVTTDTDLKVVKELDIKLYNKVVKLRVNVGTILNPVYQEEMSAGILYEDFHCK